MYCCNFNLIGVKIASFFFVPWIKVAALKLHIISGELLNTVTQIHCMVENGHLWKILMNYNIEKVFPKVQRIKNVSLNIWNMIFFVRTFFFLGAVRPNSRIHWLVSMHCQMCSLNSRNKKSKTFSKLKRFVTPIKIKLQLVHSDIQFNNVVYNTSM